MTKEDMENASGEDEQECWFEEGECIESSEMESGSWRDCCKSGVNLATHVYGDKPGSKLELIDWMKSSSNFCIFYSFIYDPQKDVPAKKFSENLDWNVNHNLKRDKQILFS